MKYRPGICVCERRIPHFCGQDFPLFILCFLTVNSFYQGNRFVSYDGFSERYVKYLLHRTRIKSLACNTPFNCDMYLPLECSVVIFFIIKVLFLTHINNASMANNPFRRRVYLNGNRSTLGLVQCSIAVANKQKPSLGQIIGSGFNENPET